MACRMEKNSRKFSLVWKDSVLIQKLFQKKSTSYLGEEDRSEALMSPLPLAWDVMRELHLSTGGSNVALFHLFHIPKLQRENPSVTSQVREIQLDPFPLGPFHGRALLEHMTSHCSMATSVGWLECGAPRASSHGLSDWRVLRGTAHCHWNQKHLLSRQDVSETEKSFEIP